MLALRRLAGFAAFEPLLIESIDYHRLQTLIGYSSLSPCLSGHRSGTGLCQRYLLRRSLAIWCCILGPTESLRNFHRRYSGSRHLAEQQVSPNSSHSASIADRGGKTILLDKKLMCVAA